MLSDIDLAVRANGRLEVRTDALRLKWDLSDLVSSDGHRLRGTFRCTVRALPESNEQKMLLEALMPSGWRVTTDDVVRHFSTGIDSAARAFAANGGADQLLSEKSRQELCQSLLHAAEKIAFTSGLKIFAPVSIDLNCPTLEQTRIAERLAADRAVQVRRRADLFAGARHAPDTARLLAVAGMSLIEISTAKANPSVIALPPAIGPARSLRADIAGGLFLGCRRGVMCGEIDHNPICYAMPGLESELGFNSAVVLNDLLYATHGEAGLVSWKIGQLDAPIAQHRAAGARGALKLEADRMVYAVGNQLMVVSAGQTPRAISAEEDCDIVGIFQSPGNAIVIYRNGVIEIRGLGLEIERKNRRCGTVIAAGSMDWLGEIRLLLATEQGPLICVGIDDELVTHFASAHVAPRMVAGSGSRVAAVTADRQRLIVWNTDDGRTPAAEFHLGSLARHRIADISFA